MEIGITQRPSHTGLHQAANVALTGAALAGITAGTTRLARSAELGHYIVFDRSSVKPGTGTIYQQCSQKIYNFLAKAGEKIFPSGGKVSNVLEKYLKHVPRANGGVLQEKAVVRLLRKAKGNVVLLGAAAVAGLVTLGAGIFNAGKIQGKASK